MKSVASLLVAAAVALAALPALADALPPDPCTSKAAGDSCIDWGNKPGVCVAGTMCMPAPCLVCDTSGSSSSSSSGGATTSSSSSGGATTSSSSSGSATSSSSSGEPASESGGSCALTPGVSSGAIVAAVLALLGVGATARRGRRRNAR